MIEELDGKGDKNAALNELWRTGYFDACITLLDGRFSQSGNSQFFFYLVGRIELLRGTRIASGQACEQRL